MVDYPKFYRKGSKCLMREGDTHGTQVEIPEACKVVNVIHSRVTLSSKELFDEMVKHMQPVTSDVYEKYLMFFYQIRSHQLKLSRRKDISLFKEKIAINS